MFWCFWALSYYQCVWLIGVALYVFNVELELKSSLLLPFQIKNRKHTEITFKCKFVLLLYIKPDTGSMHWCPGKEIHCWVEEPDIEGVCSPGKDIHCWVEELCIDVLVKGFIAGIEEIMCIVRTCPGEGFNSREINTPSSIHSKGRN